MPDLAAPLWLAGLALVPFVYWLHCFHGAEDERTVSALFLWPAANSPAGSSHRRVRPPRIWQLRALVVILICVGLARPSLPRSGSPPLVVWVDESISLRTVENGRTRGETLFTDLSDAIAARGGEDIQIRSLANAGRRLAVVADSELAATLQHWTRDFTGEPLPPVPALAAGNAEHWLVTDGVSAGVSEWVQRLPVTRVFQAGKLSSNGAVGLLAMRADIGSGGGHAVTVRVDNAGPAASTRELALTADDRLIVRQTLAVPAGGSQQLEFTVDDPLPTVLTARIEPPDALALDDALALSTGDLAPARVLVTGVCPPALARALASHPGLVTGRATDPPPADLVVACSNPPPDNTTATLFFDTRPSSPSGQPLVWHAGADDLADGPLGDFRPPIRPVETTGRTLASVDGQPVIVQTRDEPAVIQVGIDMNSPGRVDHPGYPALVAALAGRALQRDLLDPLARTSARGPATIAVRAVGLASGRHAPPPVTATSGLAGWLCVAAAMLALADATLLRRRFRALRSGA